MSIALVVSQINAEFINGLACKLSLTPFSARLGSTTIAREVGAHGLD